MDTFGYMDKSHRHNIVEWHKPDSEEFIPYGPIDRKFENKQNKLAVDRNHKSNHFLGGWIQLPITWDR